MLRDGTILTSHETGYCPSASAIVEELKELIDEDDYVLAVSPTSAPLVYYAVRQNLSLNHFAWPENQRQVFVVTSIYEHQTVLSVLDALELKQQFAEHSARKIFESSDTQLYCLEPAEVINDSQ